MYKILFALLLFSCSDFIKMTDSSYEQEISLKENKTFSLLFSHNINGETHPCGCRKFPLGGLPQVFGKMEHIKKNHPLIYVDSGDTFFDSPVVPDFTKASSIYKAEKLAEALGQLGLKIMTPGDQDFAMGTDFLLQLSLKNNFKFLVTNQKEDNPLKALKKYTLNLGSKKLIFFGVVEPSLLRPQYRKLFSDPLQALESELKDIEKDAVLILLSHSGLDYDQKIALKFPQFDWIIGAHSQSFLSTPKETNNTKIVQVLSRNHYLGEIKFSDETSYELLEMREEVKDLVTPNPMVAWLDKYKSGLDEVLAVEQSLLSSEFAGSTKLPTYISCSECHSKQVDFWQETAHSLAYTTLIKEKASNNPQCIKCHSVGLNSNEGFTSKENIVVSKNENFNQEKYWQELSKAIQFEHPVRHLKKTKRKEKIKAWVKFDQTQEVTHNFANVQCLNCHVQDGEHPFSVNTTALSDEGMQAKCLACHTRDQSPEWYTKDAKGLPTQLSQVTYKSHLKQVACPKIER